jgi:hypothetical protein
MENRVAGGKKTGNRWTKWEKIKDSNVAEG